MSDTIRSIRAEAHRIELQVERFQPGYREHIQVGKYVWDEKDHKCRRLMMAIVRCTLA